MGEPRTTSRQPDTTAAARPAAGPAARPVGTAGPRREATEAEAATLASAVRLRILRLTYDRPLTNKEIAARLRRDPATTLHHVRKLAQHGFLEALPARRGNRGAREIPYRATGLSWRLDREDASDATQQAVTEAMLEAYLGEVADIPPGTLVQTRLVVQLDPAGQRELQDRLYALMEEYATREPDPDGERIALYLASYPGD